MGIDLKNVINMFRGVKKNTYATIKYVQKEINGIKNVFRFRFRVPTVFKWIKFFRF
jgi:hypothetical protein